MRMNHIVAVLAVVVCSLFASSAVAGGTSCHVVCSNGDACLGFAATSAAECLELCTSSASTCSNVPCASLAVCDWDPDTNDSIPGTSVIPDDDDAVCELGITCDEHICKTVTYRTEDGDCLIEVGEKVDFETTIEVTHFNHLNCVPNGNDIWTNVVVRRDFCRIYPTVLW